MANDGRCISLFVALIAVGTMDAQVPADFAVADGLRGPHGVAIDETSRVLYVADSANHRVLRYDSMDTISAATLPTAVFGQPNLTETRQNQGQQNPSQGSLCYPWGVWVDAASTLWVADTGNSRVVWWADAHALSNGSLATGYVGQPSWTNFSSGPDYLLAPLGLVTAPDGTLWVTDRTRVLRYSPPIVSGAFPDGVMGFANFSFLTDVRFDGAGNLYVADGIGNRLLFIPQEETSKSVGGAASFVYGQSNLSSGIQEQTSAASLFYPRGLAFADGMVVVCSSAENRVMVFPPGPPASNDIAAIRVLGQPDFVSHSSGSTLARMWLPYGAAYDGVANTLWVADTYNNRILRFSDFIVPVQDLASLDVVVAFPGRQPTVFVYPKDPMTANIYPGQKQLLIRPQAIEELDGSNKTVISATALPLLNYTVSTSVDTWDNQRFTFSSVLPGGAQLSIRYSLFAVGQTLNSSGVSFDTKPSDLKFEVALSGWPFAHPSNTLRLHLLLSVTPNVTSILQNNSANTNITTFTLLSSNETMTTTMRMIGYGTVDGVNTPISFSLAQNQTDPGLLSLVLEIPHFTSSFQYDPDFSVTLPSSQQQEDSSSATDDLLPLLSLIALILIPVTLVAIVVLVALLLWARRQHILWATRKGMAGNVTLQVDRDEDNVL